MAHASKPKDRAALALAVGVGSLVEEESERGVAHILEHLAFNATEVLVFALLYVDVDLMPKSNDANWKYLLQRLPLLSLVSL